MNWKQLYTLSTPHERLDLLCRMLRLLETRHAVSPSPILRTPKWGRAGVGAHWLTANS